MASICITAVPACGKHWSKGSWIGQSVISMQAYQTHDRGPVSWTALDIENVKIHGIRQDLV